MPLFDFDVISEIHGKAVTAGLFHNRSALLAGLDQSYVATLEENDQPSAQMLLDLRAMNSTDRAVGTENPEIPLRIWLSNAALLVAAQPDLQSWFASLRDRTTARQEPSPVETQQRAETTLNNMQAIAGDNAPLRAALVAASHDLDEIARTVKLLVVYKALHDHLHEVQILKLPMIVANLRRGLTSTEDWAMFSQQVSDLEYKHARAMEEVARLPEGSIERADQESSLNDLRDVDDTLKQVISDKMQEGANDAIFELRRLVGKKMSDLNMLLYYSARQLRLDALIENLRAFAASLPVEDARAGQLREAATQLLLLKSEIESLLRDHNTWQQVDDDLFAAEGALVFGGQGEMVLRSFSVLWPRVIGRLAKVAGAGTDSWYVRTQEYATAFGTHCPLPATAPIAPAAIDEFREFLKVTRDRFFLVDKELKMRCDRLAEVADPIEKLARLQ